MNSLNSIDDERSKMILDFLAQRIGLEYVSLRRMLTHGNKICLYADNATFAVPLMKEKKQCHLDLVSYENMPSWSEILKSLLEICSKGESIVSSLYIMPRTFMRKNESLESILIEMDLDQKELK